MRRRQWWVDGIIKINAQEINDNKFVANSFKQLQCDLNSKI